MNRDRLESIYRQQSWQMWLKEGDINASFFKLSTLIQRRHNKILAIKHKGDWIQEEDRIANHFIEQFEDLFKSNNPTYLEEIKEIGAKVVTKKDNRELLKIPTPKEIKESIWQLHPLKSPEPDGFSGIFFRFYWKIIQERIINCV